MIRCPNGHEIPMREVVGRDIPTLHCWQCAFTPPEEENTDDSAHPARP